LALRLECDGEPTLGVGGRQCGGRPTWKFPWPNSRFVPKPTFAAFLDDIDSGAALGYSPFAGTKLWSVTSRPSLPSMRFAAEQKAEPIRL